jgi:UDP-GlcNAc:undecaprenyl-phosphate GlcNAc-1-phosphate transferase
VRTASVAFLAAAVTGGALTPVVRNLARRRGLFDHALTSRKIHGKAIPRLGGVAIVAAFYAPLAALLVVDSGVGRQFYADPSRALGLFLGGLAIAALGVYDDLRGAGARTKFAVQFGVAGLMYALGFRIDQIANPFGAPIPLGILALPFTMLWIAGVVNAMNLIDGLDGLAGGVALAAIGTTFAISAVNGQPLMVLFTAALGGAVLGFLFYNFNPATIFMGDTGSMFLGFVLATASIQTNLKSPTAVAIAVPIIALGVPIADTLLAMARRAARGAPLFSADRGHIHHRLLALGLTHRQAVLVLYGASILLGAAALVLTFASSVHAAFVLVGLSVAAFLALRRLGFLDMRKVEALLEERRRNHALRATVQHAARALRRSSCAEEVLEAVRVSAGDLGAVAVALRAGALGKQRWSVGFDAAGPTAFRAQFGLSPERPGEDHLELAWADGRTSIDRDVEVAVEALCGHLSGALQRVTPVPGRFVAKRGEPRN